MFSIIILLFIPYLCPILQYYNDSLLVYHILHYKLYKYEKALI